MADQTKEELRRIIKKLEEKLANADAQHKQSLNESSKLNKALKLLNRDLDQQVKELKHALQESENRLRLALEGSKEGLWVVDFVDDKMHFTSISAEMLGYSLDELGDTSEKWQQYTHPDDWPLVKKALNDHFEGKTDFYEAEYRAKTKSNEWKWILGHGRVTKRDKKGKPLEVIGTHVDITNLKHTQLLLIKSEERFRSLVENTPLGLLILDSSRKIEYFNPKFTEIFGYSKEDLPNVDAWFNKAYPNDEYRKNVIEIWEKIWQSPPTIRTFESKIRTVRCKYGEEKIIKFRHVSLRQEKYFVVYEDITARVKAEETLKNREKDLEVKSSNLEEMNVALKVLLQRRAEDKIEMEEKILCNVKDLISPYLEKLDSSGLKENQASYLYVLKSNLENIIAPFAKKLSAVQLNFTPREIQVANLIKENKTTKEIAEMLRVSESSVDFHRHNIRKKIGLLNKKINLTSHLKLM
jgi:PAS domain S-box-containing protein